MSAAAVLVVDDDATCRQRCRSALEAAQIPVRCAASAEAALDCFASDPKLHGTCGLVVCDYLMPGRDGLSLFCELRGQRPDLSGILLTGNASLSIAVEALNRGFSQVLSKPVDAVSLVEAVELALRERRIRRENERLRALSHLYGALRSLTALTDADEVAQRIVALARDETTADTASLMVLEPERRVLRLAAGIGLEQDLVGRSEVPLGEPIAGWVLERGVTLELAAGRPIPGVIRTAMRRRGVQAAVVVPLLPAGRKLGVLSVSWLVGTAGFGAGDVELISVLAADAAHLLQRAQHQAQRLRHERVATIGRLASSIIHDLRSPVTVIRGAAELLADLDPRCAPPMAQIAAQAGDLDQMCELLLSFARASDDLAREPFRVAELLEEVATHAPATMLEASPEAQTLELAGACGELARVLGNVLRCAPEPAGLTVTREPEGAALHLTSPAQPDDIFEVGMILLLNVVERMGGIAIPLRQGATAGWRILLPVAIGPVQGTGDRPPEPD